MKPNVYVTRLIPAEGLDLLRAVCEVEVNPDDRPLGRDELLAKVRDKDGVIGLLTDRIDGEFFDAAPRLKGYANYAVGFDNIDVAEATRRGIPVSNTPGVLTTPRAELAWALCSPWPARGRGRRGPALGAMGRLGAAPVFGCGRLRQDPGHCRGRAHRHGHGAHVQGVPHARGLFQLVGPPQRGARSRTRRAARAVRGPA